MEIQHGSDVVIVGAGFGGIRVAKTLARTDLRLLLVDRHNYHTFQPLLYQVATAGLGPEHVSHSLRDIFQKQKNFNFRMETVESVDFDSQHVHFRENKPASYEYLVLAAGASVNFFGIEGARKHAIPIKNLSNAVHLRSHILEQFEMAKTDPDKVKDGLLNFVLVGGGPTGVETAGALVELFDHVLRWDYSEELVDQARVILLEMLPHVLNSYDPALRQYTREALEDRGVDVLVETTVERVTGDTVFLKEDAPIDTQTLIWCGGVKANPLADGLDVKQTKGGRIVVKNDLRLPDRDRVFAIGDIAGATDEEGELLPQLAPFAIQQGKHAASQIKKLEQGKETDFFQYNNPGQMATVGRHAAVVELSGGYRLTGFFAWLIWVFLHIAKLIGFRNKLMVFMSWVYNYFTYGSSSRLILEVEREFDNIETQTEQNR